MAQFGEARVLVDESVLRVQRRFMERTLAPILTAMQERYRETLAQGLRQLDGFEANSLALENWTERMVHRLTHIPISALRGIAREGGDDAIRAFFDGADSKLEAVVANTLDRDDRFHAPSSRGEGL